MLFSGKLPTAQSKNLYCCKRDVSTTVDMTSSRFFGIWVNCYIIAFIFFTTLADLSKAYSIKLHFG